MAQQLKHDGCARRNASDRERGLQTRVRKRARLGCCAEEAGVAAAGLNSDVQSDFRKQEVQQKWQEARRRARNNVVGAVGAIWRGVGGNGGNSNGGGWLRRFRDGDGDDFPKGFGSISALCFMLAKLLVCWCSADPAFAAKLVDVGFLLGLSLVAIASLTPSLITARPVLVELALMHIGLELFFYGFSLPRLDPSSSQQLGPAMFAHHIATIMGGVYMLAMGRSAPLRVRVTWPRFSVFHWCSVQLLITEITSFLPVAFHQAIQDGRMDAKRQSVIGVVFPLAFVARTVLSIFVTANFLHAVRALGPMRVEYWPVGAVAGTTLASLNIMWTYRIVQGTVKAMQKQMKKKAAVRA